LANRGESEQEEEIRVKLSPIVKNTRMRGSTFSSKLSDWKDLRIFFRLVFDVLRKPSEVDDLLSTAKGHATCDIQRAKTELGESKT
jgi:hypothetical protein